MKRTLTVASMMLAMAPASLWACPVCFGASDGPLVQASGWGIATLLVVTLLMLGAFAAFFLTLRRRAMRAAAASDNLGKSPATAEVQC